MTDVQLPFGNYRSTDPETSKAAAALPRTTLRARVEQALRDLGPATDFEITEYLRLPPEKKPSCGKRRQELGCIDTQLRRKSPDGNASVVWRLPS